MARVKEINAFILYVAMELKLQVNTISATNEGGRFDA